MSAAPQSPHRAGHYIGAAILILIGVAALIANLGGGKLAGDSIPLAIGAAFVIAYVLTRGYGFLVPGGIVTGVGAGLLVADLAGASDNGPYIVIGAGLGFLFVYAFDLLATGPTRWWPVIPGGIMLVVGAGTVTENQSTLHDVGVWSPALLILLGVLVLAINVRRIQS